MSFHAVIFQTTLPSDREARWAPQGERPVEGASLRQAAAMLDEPVIGDALLMLKAPGWRGRSCAASRQT